MGETLVVWGVLAGLVTLAALLHRGRRRPSRRPGPPVSPHPAATTDLGLDPADVAELQAVARRVLGELPEPSSALVRHLQVLVARGVPVRRIDASGWPQRWFLGFADGSRVVVTAPDPTPVIAMRLAIVHGTVRLQRILHVEGGLQLEFAGVQARHRVLAVADA